MFRKLAVALSIVASPALAQDAAPAPAPSEPASEAEAPVAYKTKKVCRSIEVVGSSIPRRACTTKRVPIKPVDADAEGDAAGTARPKDPDASE